MLPALDDHYNPVEYDIASFPWQLFPEPPSISARWSKTTREHRYLCKAMPAGLRLSYIHTYSSSDVTTIPDVYSEEINSSVCATPTPSITQALSTRLNRNDSLLFSLETNPSPKEQLSLAASLYILDENGSRIRFGDLWEKQRTVVLFTIGAPCAKTTYFPLCALFRPHPHSHDTTHRLDLSSSLTVHHI